jgi:hypothetical protein
MRPWLLIALAAALPVSAQAPRAEYGSLMRAYVDTFRVLGRSKQCGLNFDAEPFFREVARRHGADSEPVRVAGLVFTAAAENLVLSRDIDPAPPAPMPCDVVALMRGGIRLPDNIAR